MIDDKKGTKHPLSMVIDEVVYIFSDLGFTVELGPELEETKYNFDMMNFPLDHPARDMQDTFFIKDKPNFVLRTHTSNVQARFMEKFAKENKKPPFAIIVPGKVFRSESTDSGHEMQFHQLEGLMIGSDINVANMKAILLKFFEKFFADKVEIRFRPSFFPFVEPGFEVDVKKGGKWFEVLGAGLVHPKVLENCGIDSTKYQGFAFGFGLDRFMMIKYGISDVRLSYQGDLRLNQF